MCRVLCLSAVCCSVLSCVYVSCNCPPIYPVSPPWYCTSLSSLQILESASGFFRFLILSFPPLVRPLDFSDLFLNPRSRWLLSSISWTISFACPRFIYLWPPIRCFSLLSDAPVDPSNRLAEKTKTKNKQKQNLFLILPSLGVAVLPLFLSSIFYSIQLYFISNFEFQIPNFQSLSLLSFAASIFANRRLEFSPSRGELLLAFFFLQ
jgi:hypothetical protein